MGESGYHRILNHLTQGSSILLQLPAIRWAWLTILRKARRGEVRDLTVASLILEAHITVEEATDALRIFTSPDPLSTSPEEDGRRLIAINGEPGAYRLVNWDRYAERIERANASTRKARSRDVSRNAAKSHGVPRSAAHGRQETVDSEPKTESKAEKAPRAPVREAKTEPAPAAVLSPDWKAVERLMELVKRADLYPPPDEQCIGLLLSNVGEDIVTEALTTRAVDMKGKGWKYLRAICESWQSDPTQRPGKKPKREPVEPSRAVPHFTLPPAKP